mgnify:CR=1 FL=1
MIGAVIHRFDEVTSTNDEARRLAGEGAVEGTVVTAVYQTHGRGSRGRVWMSPPAANLLFSVILRPDIPVQRNGELAFVAACGAANGLRDAFCLDVRVKWPNDIVVGSRKIGGIIIEAGSGFAVVGIGVNINWTEFPAEIAESATSVALEVGEIVDIEKAFQCMLASLNAAYLDYKEFGFAKILNDWRRLDCCVGKCVEIEVDGRVVSGKSVGVDDGGSLLVETNQGMVERIPSAGCVLRWDS